MLFVLLFLMVTARAEAHTVLKEIGAFLESSEERGSGLLVHVHNKDIDE